LPSERRSLGQAQGEAQNQQSSQKQGQCEKPESRPGLLVLNDWLRLGRLRIENVELLEQIVEFLDVPIDQFEDFGHFKDRIIPAIHEMQI